MTTAQNNKPLCLDFIDHQKAFGLVKEAMVNQLYENKKLLMKL